MLVGHVDTPGKQTARSVMTRLVVGELDKSSEIWCERGTRVQDGQRLEGPRFTEMPLPWKRATGETETTSSGAPIRRVAKCVWNDAFCGTV